MEICFERKMRNEYRITRFGHDFPFLTDDNIGNLLIIAQQSSEDYTAFVLSSDDDIEDFLSAFNLTIEDTNQLIDTKSLAKTDNALAFQLSETKAEEKPDDVFAVLLKQFVEKCDDFPSTQEMSQFARNAYNKAYHVAEQEFLADPDAFLLKWIEAEYTVFRALERKIHAEICLHPFPDIDQFIAAANSILNTRKSRAGKALEHHLSAIFKANRLHFEEQALTEGHKRPDFVFPNGACYHNFEFPSNKLTILGAKTTCKDRWRQVATEADRADFKYLFTTQP